jgi:hypothetical protein
MKTGYGSYLGQQRISHTDEINAVHGIGLR